MKRLSSKLFVSQLAVIVVLTGLILFFTFQTVRQHYLESLVQDLITINKSVQFTIRNDVFDSSPQLNNKVKNIGKKLNIRVTIVMPDGEVIADSENDPKKMDNHFGRPEIQNALTDEVAHKIRYSNTVYDDMLYLAMPIKQKNQVVAICRVSILTSKSDKLISQLRQDMVEISIVVTLLSLLLVLLISRNILKPINQLTNAARLVAEGDFDVKVKLKGNDEIAELALNFNNMTRRIKKLFEKVSSQSEELNSLITTINEGLVVVNSKFDILLYNESFKKIAGITNLSGIKLNTIFKDDLIADFVLETKKRRIGYSIEYLFNNDYFLLSSSYVESKDEVVLIFHNINENKKFDNIKRDFVVNVSHELRTPLTAIKGFIETLEDEVGQEQKHYINIINRHTDRLINIVNDLLVIAELEEKSIRLDISEVNLTESVNNILQIYQPKLKDKNLQLTFLCDEELITINADKFRIEQLFVNLIDNAIKYTDEGEINIRISSDKANTIIEVRDTGLGIPKADQARIFERFYIVDKSRSRRVGGTGLGLSIVKHIVQLHKGQIILESDTGKGSKFVIILPNDLG